MWFAGNKKVVEYRGCQRRSDRLCFFAAHQPYARISPFLLDYLDELNRCGFDVVVCFAGPLGDEQSLARLRRSCVSVIVRDNVGHDFRSWKTCFDVVPDWQTSSVLLLANDSVLGPLRPLSTVFEKMRRAQASLVGLSDSAERGYHLQSFFIYVKADVLRSRPFARFWRRVKVLKSKKDIIKRYEVGLSQQMLSAGFTVEAVTRFEDVRARCRELGDEFQYPAILQKPAFNTTLYCWYELVKYFDYPFIKADVIKNDRYQSRHIDAAEEFLAIASSIEKQDFIKQLVQTATPGEGKS